MLSPKPPHIQHTAFTVNLTLTPKIVVALSPVCVCVCVNSDSGVSDLQRSGDEIDRLVLWAVDDGKGERLVVVRVEVAEHVRVRAQAHFLA